MHSNEMDLRKINTHEEVRKIAEDIANRQESEYTKACYITLLEAIIFYLIRHQKPDKQNTSMIFALLCQAKADPKTGISQLDSIFNEVRRFASNDICIQKYKFFKRQLNSPNAHP